MPTWAILAASSSGRQLGCPGPAGSVGRGHGQGELAARQRTPSSAARRRKATHDLSSACSRLPATDGHTLYAARINLHARQLMEDTPRSELQQAHQPSPPPLASPPSPSTVAPGVAAFLRGQASIVYLSNRIEAEYLAQGMAGAGYPDSQLAGDGEPAWRIARAVEQLSLQAGLYPGASAAESFVGDHAGQPAGSFSSSSSMAGSTPYVQQSDQHQLGLGSQAFAPQSYHSASTSALFDQGAYYAALGPQPQVLAANSRLDYSRAMQHHLSQQFASASLAESQQVFGSPAMMSTVFTSPLLHQATAAGRPVEHRSHLQQQQQLQQHQQPAYNGLTGNGYHGFLPSSAMTPLTSIIPPSIAPPTTASPKPADRRASAGSTLATLPETSFGAPAMW